MYQKIYKDKFFFLLIIAFFASLFLYSIPYSLAQTSEKKIENPTKIEENKGKTVSQKKDTFKVQTPYDKKLLRLSEILGSLYYLETLCPDQNTSAPSHQWRNLMQSLIQQENFDKKRTARFFEAFNHAYRGYAQNYRFCTKMALTAKDFYQKKGLFLTKDLLRRYGPTF